MPNKKSNPSKRGTDVDRQIIESHHAAARGDVLFDSGDLVVKRAVWTLTQSPPRNFLTLPHWLQSTFDTTLTLSTSGAVVENAQGFTLAQFPDVAAIAALYDQYCIYAVSSRAVIEPSLSTGVANAAYGIIATALDFDSSGNVTSLGAIERFSTVIISELIPGKSYERFVKPCVASVMGGSNSVTPVGLGTCRSWLNNALTSTPHFGIRHLTVNNTSATSVVVRLFFTAVIGVRNNI